MKLRMGTRGSRLALTQSRWVADRLEKRSGVEVELVTIRTSGDVLQDHPLSEIGGQGIFTKELDSALLEGRVDLAVHSLKDLPTESPPGLSIGAIPEREDARDVLIASEGSGATLLTLPAGARIGTSSLRRMALVRASRPDLRVEDIRGNVETRIRRVDEGEFDGIVLAAAGVRRLGLAGRISEFLEAGSWLPAPGQGALAIVVRSEDRAGAGWLQPLDHEPTRAATEAERALLHALGAGCRLPVAALGLPFDGEIRLRGLVASPDGRRLVRAEATGPAGSAVALGEHVAGRLLERGADLLLGAIQVSEREGDR
jgi:hydroxymethylbilane synthase